ncbi:probable NADH dehydrogenase [ubiquinone] flavoprotein 2, mitochondrial [Drosophila eugracilis]|uniref:probable NADH dehydrogenase [ubiquinone] flavoprotein 2, mitochondrial n=1 Tax=Drosophila eugracilis TaxID=29029 RepID=UPI0007E87974|nr:probable NADH dehydrogenase [ubiquinone] flavoprotein 2, mitochondrial [Drosophila eugracilis]
MQPLLHRIRSIHVSQVLRTAAKTDLRGMREKLKFEFSEDNKRRVKALLAWYPEAEWKGALIPLLDIAQRQQGWLSISALHAVAEVIKIDPMDAYEAAQFYTMFFMKPRGKYVVSVCTSTPCKLRGGDEIFEACKKTLNLEHGQTTPDMQFTLKEDYCMGACVNAPVLAVNDDMYEDLDEKSLGDILADLRCDKLPPAGPRNGRFASEPKGGPTTLKTQPPPPGFKMQELSDPKTKKCQ